MKTVESSAVFQPKQWPEKASREDNRKQDPTRTCAQSGVKIEHCSKCPYIYAYAPALMPQGDARIYLLAAMDLAFVVSVFLMGGEFWEKVRRIFVYEGKI